MFKINIIPNMERFFDLVARSRGKVLLQLPDNTQYNLKEEGSVRQLFKTMRPGQDGVRITLSDPCDIPAFINYMIGA